MREKYKEKLGGDSKGFEKYLETINRQIKDIEKLVNEFSNFARMPRPILKKIDISQIINKSLDFIKITSKNSFNLINNSNGSFIKGDEDQLNRVFINLIKNSKSPSFGSNSKRAQF